MRVCIVAKGLDDAAGARIAPRPGRAQALAAARRETWRGELGRRGGDGADGADETMGNAASAGWDAAGRTSQALSQPGSLERSCRAEVAMVLSPWPTPRVCSGERSSGMNRTEMYRAGPASQPTPWPTPGTDSFRSRSRSGERKQEMGLDQLARRSANWSTLRAERRAKGGPNQAFAPSLARGVDQFAERRAS